MEYLLVAATTTLPVVVNSAAQAEEEEEGKVDVIVGKVEADEGEEAREENFGVILSAPPVSAGWILRLVRCWCCCWIRRWWWLLELAAISSTIVFVSLSLKLIFMAST